MRISDWSSDVCSSDLEPPAKRQPGLHPTRKPSTGIGGKKRLAMLCADAQTLLPQQHACKLQPVEPGRCAAAQFDRKSVVEGKSVSVRVDPGGRRSIKKHHTIKIISKHTQYKIT